MGPVGLEELEHPRVVRAGLPGQRERDHARQPVVAGGHRVGVTEPAPEHPRRRPRADPRQRLEHRRHLVAGPTDQGLEPVRPLRGSPQGVRLLAQDPEVREGGRGQAPDRLGGRIDPQRRRVGCVGPRRPGRPLAEPLGQPPTRRHRLLPGHELMQDRRGQALEDRQRRRQVDPRVAGHQPPHDRRDGHEEVRAIEQPQQRHMVRRNPRRAFSPRIDRDLCVALHHAEGGRPLGGPGRAPHLAPRGVDVQGRVAGSPSQRRLAGREIVALGREHLHPDAGRSLRRRVRWRHALRYRVALSLPSAPRLAKRPRMTKRICIISTGGTIEKTYDELDGILSNGVSVLDVMLAGLMHDGLELARVPLMNKDSRDMSDADHSLIARTAGTMAESFDGVIVVHGTDTLTQTGDRMVALLGDPRVPIVLTGAMRPYELRRTDAVQNLTEALLAVQFLDPGVYVVMHSSALRFPGIIKDYERGTFVRAPGG
ncbi:MAG: hypothetical protein CVU56_01155 [Deltaproteobacteria bacterium HGW-Deltaproteobacteria-14]|nr:MAG: hypothetical protein CVU56_01155 [Deltaproteobacteria bacterium HGW-Deltaproteobacteria-14]